MPDSKKGCGCIAFILIVAAIVAITFTGNKNTGDPSAPQRPGLSQDSTEAPLVDFEFPQYTQPDASASPLDPSAYPLSSINTLSGLFRLNLSREELMPLEDELSRIGACESTWAGSGTVGAALHQPMTIDRYNGETLVIAGSEWSNRSETQLNSMTIDLYPAALLGYGNRFMLEDVDVTDMESISGITVSAVNDDPDALNAALKGTGIKCLHCKKRKENHYDDHYHLLADSYEHTMTYGFFEGTEYIDSSASMIHPYFAYREDSPVTAPVQITTDGYFTIDISALASGYYVIDGLMGDYAIIII